MIEQANYPEGTYLSEKEMRTINMTREELKLLKGMIPYGPETQVKKPNLPTIGIKLKPIQDDGNVEQFSETYPEFYTLLNNFVFLINEVYGIEVSLGKAKGLSMRCDCYEQGVYIKHEGESIFLFNVFDADGSQMDAMVSRLYDNVSDNIYLKVDKNTKLPENTKDLLEKWKKISEENKEKKRDDLDKTYITFFIAFFRLKTYPDEKYYISDGEVEIFKKQMLEKLGMKELPASVKIGFENKANKDGLLRFTLKKDGKDVAAVSLDPHTKEYTINKMA